MNEIEVRPEAEGPEETVSPPKPRFRGRLHQVAFFLTMPAAVVLILVAHDATTRVAAAVYAAGLVGLYGVSAAYHRVPWSPQAMRRMKRLDHSMIFVLIAGTVTPVSLLVVRAPWSIVLLVAVWTGAAVGIALKMARIEGYRGVTGLLYIAMGWAVVLVAPQLVHGLSVASLSLVVAGGLSYTAGAVVLLRHKPDPAPATFGYHEIWHAMVVVGSACHYAAVLLILLIARQGR